ASYTHPSHSFFAQFFCSPAPGSAGANDYRIVDFFFSHSLDLKLGFCSFTSRETALQIFESRLRSLRWVRSFRLVFDVCGVLELDLLQQLHCFVYRSRSLAEPVLLVFGIIASVLYMQAHNARVMIADKLNGIVSRCIKVTDIKINAQIIGRAFERVDEIVGRLELLGPVSLEARVAEPVIVESKFDFVSLAPIAEPRDYRFFDRSGHNFRSQQRGAIKSAVEIIIF